MSGTRKYTSLKRSGFGCFKKGGYQVEFTKIKIDQIQTAPTQMRSRMREDEIIGLSESIKEVGLLHPILVQEIDPGKYQLIAGERRLRAVKKAGEKSILAMVLSGDRNVRHIQLIENLQRENLDPIDRAKAIKAMMDEEGLSKVGVAKKLGIPRTTLTEWLNVLEISTRFQDALLNNHYGGSSPLTISHVSLAKRFAQKVCVDSEDVQNVTEMVLDAVLYYRLTRSETKKVLELLENKRTIPIDVAIKQVRVMPSNSKEPTNSTWNVNELVTFLARSGNYLVKCKPENLYNLDEDEKEELLRQSKVLIRLLNDTIAQLDTTGKGIKEGLM